jgi:hypothetical protein
VENQKSFYCESIASQMQIKTQQAVCHTLALPFTLKNILRQKKKRKIMKAQIFHHAKIIIFKKKSSKRNPESFKIL